MTQNKTCPECDHINLNNAKFCSECGYDLTSDSKPLKSKNCKKCGEENSEEEYCINCGVAFNSHKQKAQDKRRVKKSLSNKQIRQKEPSTSSFSKYSLLFVISGLILVFIIVDNNKNEIPAQENFTGQPTTQDFTLEGKVMEVASKFTCSCGSCGEEALEICTCNTAEQERNFIRQELKSGKSVSQTIVSVKTKYGHLKSEYVNKIEGGGLNLNLSAQGQDDIFSQISGSSSNNNIKIASSDDRKEILSHFECPCGQCGMLELAECNCTHPKGATEVKLFVDAQIDYQKYTVNDIVEMVEKKYGHKIR
jgi:hypothetical protein